MSVDAIWAWESDKRYWAPEPLTPPTKSMVLGSGGKRYVSEALMDDAKRVFFKQEKRIADLEAWTARLEDEVLAGKNSCPHKPQDTKGAIGMYHCPECGVMLLAGMAHPNDEGVREQGLVPYCEIDAAVEAIGNSLEEGMSESQDRPTTYIDGHGTEYYIVAQGQGGGADNEMIAYRQVQPHIQKDADDPRVMDSEFTQAEIDQQGDREEPATFFITKALFFRHMSIYR